MSPQYIMRMLELFSTSDEGKKFIKEKTGKDFTLDRSNQFHDLLFQIKTLLWERIHEKITSISLSDVYLSEYYHEDGNSVACATIGITNVNRQSLYPKGYPEGIDNIVRLFATGYHASNYVYGIWEHSGSRTSKKIRSRKTRLPDDYLMRFEEEANRRFYPAEVSLDRSYVTN